MHFRNILQKCTETTGTLDGWKSGTTNQNCDLKYMKLNKMGLSVSKCKNLCWFLQAVTLKCQIPGN